MAGVELRPVRRSDPRIPGVVVVGETTPSLPSPRIIADDDWTRWINQGGGASPESFRGGEKPESYVEQLRVAIGPSGYVPSLIHPDIVATQLTEYDVLEKYQVGHEVAQAAEAMMIDLLRQSGGEFDFLSDEEAWNGVKSEDGSEILGPLPMETSPGDPWQHLLPKGRRSKADLLEAMPKTVLEYLRKDYESLNSCTPYQWPQGQTIKVELRDVERVALKKSRLYDGGPLAYTWTSRKLLGNFLAKMYKMAKTLRFFSCAGMDVFRGKWNLFVQNLTNEFEGVLVPTDASKWDKNYPFWILDVYRNVLESLCVNSEYWRIGQHEERMRYSPVLLKALGVFYLATCGNRSGRADTVMVNTIGLLFVMFLSWCENTPPEQWSIQAFFSNISPRILGDDNLSNFSLHSPVTYEMVFKTFRNLNWQVEIEGAIGGPADVMFAGRRSMWVKQAQQWWPVLPRGRIIAIMEWIKNGRGAQQKLERWSAGVVYAFPLLFAEPCDPLFYVIWEGFRSKHREAARLPGASAPHSHLLSSLYFLYSGFKISEGLISRFYFDYVNTSRAEEEARRQTAFANATATAFCDPADPHIAPRGSCEESSGGTTKILP